jgi:hypothetical protein
MGHAVLTPLQVSAVSQRSAAARQVVPAEIGLHVPNDPGLLHDWQSDDPAQAELQQTPSAQKPLRHELPSVHDAPLALFCTV